MRSGLLLSLLLLLALASGVGAQERCAPEPLEWWTRQSLERWLERSLPWLARPWAAEPQICRDPDGHLRARLELSPHLERPRWDLHFELACRERGFSDWECEPPEEHTRVRLARSDPGTRILGRVPIEDATAALGAVITRSRRGRILDPFGPEDVLPPLRSADFTSVSRVEFCAGLLVRVRAPAGSGRLDLCVEPGRCGREGCPLSVILTGKTEDDDG